ncbi:hypothetical protein [Nocardia sp. IFM 10818]
MSMVFGVGWVLFVSGMLVGFVSYGFRWSDRVRRVTLPMWVAGAGLLAVSMPVLADEPVVINVLARTACTGLALAGVIAIVAQRRHTSTPTS